MRSALMFVCTLMLGTAVVTAPLLHDVVPHSHGAQLASSLSHDHDKTGDGKNQESAVWSSLHSALGSRKKMLDSLLPTAIILLASVLIAWWLVQVTQLVGRRYRLDIRVMSLFNKQLGSALRRGIVAHRKFR